MNLLKRLNQLTAQLDHQHVHHHPIPQTNSKSSIHTTPLPLRLSASLIIIKPLETITPDGFNYHTLLIQRNSSQRSFSSAYVFPGGNLDPEDRNHQSLIQTSPDDQITPLNEAKVLQDSLKICAIRETFEEAGILVGLTHPMNTSNPNSLKSFRQKLTNQETKFTHINQFLKNIDPSGGTQDSLNNISKNNLFDLDRFWHVANILTPTVFTKRWDTHFYLTILPSPGVASNGGEDRVKSSYMATPDGSETVSTVWMSPNEALQRCIMEPASTSNSSYITLAPPQFYLLRDLTEKKDYRELTEWKGRIVPPFTPELVKCDVDNSALVLPGDPLHSSSTVILQNNKKTCNPSHNSSKHRIYVHNEKHDFANQQGKFFRPISVIRSGMIDILGSGWHDLA